MPRSHQHINSIHNYTYLMPLSNFIL